MVLSSGHQGKVKSLLQGGDAPGDNNSEHVILHSVQQGSLLNGWNIAEMLIVWHERKLRGKGTFALERSLRNLALTGLFNDTPMKKNWCLLKMKICSYSVLNFGLQRTNLPRHTFFLYLRPLEHTLYITHADLC